MSESTGEKPSDALIREVQGHLQSAGFIESDYEKDLWIREGHQLLGDHRVKIYPAVLDTTPSFMATFTGFLERLPGLIDALQSTEPRFTLEEIEKAIRVDWPFLARAILPDLLTRLQESRR